MGCLKLHSGKCHRTLLMISQHWFRYWLSAVRQQTITWASVHPYLCKCKATLGPNELTHWGRDKMIAIFVEFYMIFSINTFEFQIKFHSNMCLRIQLTINHHWFRWVGGCVGRSEWCPRPQELSEFLPFTNLNNILFHWKKFIASENAKNIDIWLTVMCFH